MIVYKITNLVNNKIYIGQTKAALTTRWSQHISKHSTCTYLKRAIKKYGKDNFKITIICTASSQEELNHREALCIRLFNTLAPSGYNLMVHSHITEISAETRLKRSISLKNSWKNRINRENSWSKKPKSQAVKNKIRAALLGVRHSDERRRRQSEARIGTPAWNKGTKGVVKANSGTFGQGRTAPNKGRVKTIIDGKIRFIVPTI